MEKQVYSIIWCIFFWLLWLIGLGVLVLFAGFLLITAEDAPLIAAWNGLIVIIEIFLLFKTAYHFFRKDIPSSTLMLWVALAAFGVLLLATGGCLILENTGQRLIIGG